MVGGFVDHHVHFVATAAARISIDVSAATTVGDVVAAVKRRGRRGWLRAWGYDEAFLAERRHPTRDDLDRAWPGPVVLHHRSGHAAVLNSAALAEVGEPDHPDGVLYDRHDLLARVPRLDPSALAAAAGAVSREWAGAGIVAFTDATHTNGGGELELLARWCRDGLVSQQVTAMVGVDHLGEVPAYGGAVGTVRVGHAKVMPGPDRDAAASIGAAREAGFPAAVHVMEIDVLEEVLAVLGPGDRVEHNALCLPDQVPRLAASGAAVVVNPSFLVHRRRKYEEGLSQVEQAWLVPIRSLLAAGITVRAGSDSPVTPARPQDVVAGATAHPFSPLESVDADGALRLLSPW